MNRYVKHSDNNNKYIIFIVHDKELLQNTKKHDIRLVIY